MNVYKINFDVEEIATPKSFSWISKETAFVQAKSVEEAINKVKEKERHGHTYGEKNYDTEAKRDATVEYRRSVIMDSINLVCEISY